MKQDRRKPKNYLESEFLNECEKPQEIELSINIKKKTDIKVNLNIINIESDDDECKKFEKEFEKLVKK